MIRSMTGYARVVAGGAEDGRSWEVRAVNHRFLEIVLHLPDSLLGIEAELRRRVAQVVKRGRVELWLRHSAQEEQPSIRINPALLADLRGAVGEIAELWDAPLPEPDPLELLRWPGVLQAREIEEIQPEALLAHLDDALQELQASRLREGSALAEIFLQKLGAMEEILQSLRVQLPGIEARLAERLERRLGDLRQQVEPGRWEQELVFYLHRQDVAEEMERLTTHLAEIRQVLQRDEAVGRRLDFLVQECNREANTLGSKAGDPQVSRAAIELKVLIEQLREQIQNVE